VATVATLKALPRLVGLTPEGTSRSGGWLFLFWYALTMAVALFASRALGLPVGADADLEQLMVMTGATNLIAVFVVLLMAAFLSGGLRNLGFTARRGSASRPSGLIVGAAMWAAFIPAFGLIAWGNNALLTALDIPTDLQVQLALFNDDPAARSSVWVWLSIGLITPVCEEIAFRGLLFGGLRRFMPPVTAMVVSSAVFGLLHEPSVAIPVAALGVLLAWSYERSGSLVVPCVIHALHNTVTLAIVMAIPA
jgi:membrane protease YdiL (CAAX protease family)